MGLDIYFTRKKSKDIGHFRKVNFLVKYFNKLGFDVENQTPLCISRKDVETLLSKCKQVLECHSLAKELLPTMEGFFFGSTKYDDYYFEDVKDVKEYIENELLKQFDNLADDEQIYFETWY